MMRRFECAALVVSFVALTVLAAGCLDIPPYESCGFPPEQGELCILSSSDTDEVAIKKSASNCVIEQPQCPDNYCVSFRGSSGFCSQACEDDSDCPGSKSSCKEFAFGCDEEGNCLKLCVKGSLLD